MDRVKRLIMPAAWVRAVVVASATFLLVLCLNGAISAPAVHYAAYLYSTYALVVVCAWLPGAVRRLRSRFTGAMERCSAAHPGFESFYGIAADPERRMRALLAPSLAFNLGYAAFKLAVGIWVKSWWMIGVGAYYAILASLRHSLLRTFIDRKDAAGGARDWRAYRNTAARLLFLSLTMSGLIVQTVLYGQAYHYPGVLIYAFALYAFIKIIAAVTALIRRRHEDNAILAASRCISFACALMSMLALQTALIDRFGGGEAFARTANALFGGFVCLAMLGICAHMFSRSGRHAREESGKASAGR